MEDNTKVIDGVIFTYVAGETEDDVLLFALSTCGWCKKTKEFLKENDVSYYYVNVDLTEGEEREATIKFLEQYNPDLSFPTIVINGKTVIEGYEPEEIASKLNI